MWLRLASTDSMTGLWGLGDEVPDVADCMLYPEIEGRCIPVTLGAKLLAYGEPGTPVDTDGGDPGKFAYMSEPEGLATKPESIDAGLKGPAAPGAANEFIGTRAGYMGLACAREPSAPRDVLGDALIESAKMHCRLWPVITWCRTPVSTWRTSMKLGSKAST